ncbi:MAG: efflux RND transporter periplasmic adaptor subunit [bacterium]
MTNIDISKLKIDKSRAATSSGMEKRPFLWLLIILVILGALLFLLRKIFLPTYRVEITMVSQMYPSQAFTLLNASGYVVAQRKAAVSSKITGRLVSLLVEEGSRVKKGQVIARLEDADAASVRDQAEANLSVARFTLEQTRADLRETTLALNRCKEMLSRGFLSQADYDVCEARYQRSAAAVTAAEATVRAQAAALEGARISFDNTFIRTPFDAVVLTKNADVGDVITPLGAAANIKAAVVTIADMGSLQVEVDISESNLEKVRRGQPCEIQLDALPGYRFRGIVHMIVPTVDRTKATIMVKVRFVDEDNRVLPEMSAKVAFLSKKLTSEEMSPRTVLSPDAVVSRNGKEFVFLIQGDRAVEIPIKSGGRFGDMVEVLSGVKVGDRVVMNPKEELKDKARIEVAGL